MRTRLALLIAGVMMLGSACASSGPPQTIPPPSIDVSGTWVGTWMAFEGSGGSGELRGIFRQDGTTVYGNFEVQNQSVSRTFVSGTVVGNEIRLFAPSLGILVVNGDEMGGTVQGTVQARVQLRRQR